MCVCVRACVRACVRVCVCVCVRECVYVPMHYSTSPMPNCWSYPPPPPIFVRSSLPDKNRPDITAMVDWASSRVQELREGRGGRLGLSVSLSLSLNS